MNTINLVGRQVVVTSDIRDRVYAATIRGVDITAKSLSLEFTGPVSNDNTYGTFAVASFRLERDDFALLLSDGRIGCAVTLVPNERYDASEPFDLSWWRGGGAWIGEIMLE